MKALVVYKKTALQRYGEDDPTIRELIAADDPSVRVLRDAHDTHLRSLDRAREVLRDLGVKATFRHKHDEESDDWSIVITLGGDGTLLWASHSVGPNTPMVAINSAPDTSVGYFCAGDITEMESVLRRAFEGELVRTKLSRMRVALDDEVQSTRILNDVLFCHKVPAAATRYIISHDGCTETHTSSGIWAGPAAGSTAAQRSAGGKVLPIGSKKIQWVVREPYRPGDVHLELSRGLVKEGDALTIKSKIRDGRLYLDGAGRTIKVDIGQVIELKRSDEPLCLLGLRSRGR